VPWCACGTIRLWHGVVHSAENSQHLTDWYTFTHVLHGFDFYAALTPFRRRLPPGARFLLAMAGEATWERAVPGVRGRGARRRVRRAQHHRRGHLHGGARLVVAGSRLYRDFPFSQGPTFPFVDGWLTEPFGGSLLAGRMVSWVGCLVTAAASGRIAWRFGGALYGPSLRARLRERKRLRRMRSEAFGYLGAGNGIRTRDPQLGNRSGVASLGRPAPSPFS